MFIEIQFSGHLDPFVAEVEAWSTPHGVLELRYPGTHYSEYADIAYAQGAWVSVRRIAKNER